MWTVATTLRTPGEGTHSVNRQTALSSPRLASLGGPRTSIGRRSGARQPLSQEYPLKQQIAVILGAGFSHAAGLPLLGDLFSTTDTPKSRSKALHEDNLDVLWAWNAWCRGNPEGNAEVWLKHLYDAQGLPSSGVDWEEALRFMLGRLALVGDSPKAAYHHGITLAVASPVHRRFWSELLRAFAIRVVVTTNYDILIEQGLRSRYGHTRESPMCYYAGLRCPQVLERLTDVARRQKTLHTLKDSDTALCKLHGSINWAFDHGEFKIHEDVRPAFRSNANRRDRRPRTAAVVPPLPEKEEPFWLRDVWTAAEEHLRNTHLWVVCGSRLPGYDEAFRSLLSRAAARPSRLQILQIDESEEARRNWRVVAGPRAIIQYVRHLPHGLDDPVWRQIVGLDG